MFSILDVASNRKLLVLLLKKKGIEPKQVRDYLHRCSPVNPSHHSPTHPHTHLQYRILSPTAFSIAQAEDGSQAVELVKSLPANSFDCIFMDNTMPVMTGIEATRALRKIGYENMIIGLTGNRYSTDLSTSLHPSA